MLKYIIVAGFDFELVKEKKYYVIKSADFNMPTPVYRNLGAEYFFPFSLNKSLFLPEEIIFFMIIFGLSNLARYYPEHWQKIVTGGGNYGLFYSYIKYFLELIIIKFRVLMVPRFNSFLPAFYYPSGIMASSSKLPK